jgi:HK97 family phage major capsid protein
MTPNRAQLLGEAESLLRSVPFTKEISSKIESLLQLADRTVDHSGLRRATMQARNIELGRAPEHAELAPEEDQQFRAYLTAGQSEAREIARRRLEQVQARSQSTTTTAGGYLISQSFSDRVESMMAKYDGLFDVASPFVTKNGSATGYPLLSDEGVGAAVVAENSISTLTGDLVFATVAFGKCPMWRSDLIRASVELVQDSNLDFATLLADAVAIRFARGIGAAFVATLISTAPSGLTSAAPTALTSDEIYSLIDSVDESYSSRGSFLTKRSTLTYLRKLKASTAGSYIFPEARDAEGYPLLAGYRVYVSPSMQAMTAGLVPLSFGDHSRFVRRTVANSLEVKIYSERYAEYSQVAYEGFWRVDGALLQSSTTAPVKLLTMHA